MLNKIKNKIKKTLHEFNYKKIIYNEEDYFKLIEKEEYKKLFYNLSYLFNYILNEDIKYVKLLNKNLIKNNCNFSFDFSNNLNIYNEDMSIYFYDKNSPLKKENWDFIFKLKISDKYVILNFVESKDFIFSVLNIKIITENLIEIYNKTFNDKEKLLNNTKEKILKKYKKHN